MNTFSSARPRGTTAPARAGTDNTAKHGHQRLRRRAKFHGVVAGMMMAAWLTISVLQPRPLEAATAAPCLDAIQYQWVNCVFEAPDVWSVTLCDLAYFVGYAVCLRENPV